MSPRLSLPLASLAACLLACSPKPKTKLSSDPADAGPESAPGALATPEREGEVPEKMTLRMSAHELDDVFEAVERLVDNWDPPEPGAPGFDLLANLEQGALEAGLAPGAIEALDLHGLHTFELSIPYERYGELPASSTDMRATLAAHDPRRILSSLPAAFQPEETGPESWRITSKELSLVARSQADANLLAFATSAEALDAALADRSVRAQSQTPASPRIYTELLNPDPDQFDIAEMLDDVPGLDPTTVEALADEASFEMSFDFGTARDLFVRVGVRAPFGDKAYRMPALSGPTALAKLLPPDPLFVIQNAIGELGRFDEEARELLDDPWLPAPVRDQLAAGTLFANLGGEIIVTAYFDAKGRATLVIAVEVEDQKLARTNLRRWQRALVDEMNAKGAKATFKPGGLSLGSRKADLISLPLNNKDDEDLAKRNRWLFRDGKAELESGVLIGGGAVIVALGAGQRELLRTIAKRIDKPGRASLDGDGLALARSLTDGCHTCVAADLPAMLDALLSVVERVPEAKPEILRAAKDLHARLRAMKLDGELALAGRYDSDGYYLGLGLSNALLFADGPELVELIDQLTAFVDELLGTSAPEPREACEHIHALVADELGDDGRDAFDIDACLAKVDENRREDSARTDEELECIVEAETLDELGRCSPTD